MDSDEKMFAKFQKYLAKKRKKREYSRSRSRSPKKRSRSKSPEDNIHRKLESQRNLEQKFLKQLSEKELEISNLSRQLKKANDDVVELSRKLKKFDDDVFYWKCRAKEDNRELSDIYENFSKILFGNRHVCYSMESLTDKIFKMYRTKICRYAWGTCPVGSRCVYIHLSQERLEDALSTIYDRQRAQHQERKKSDDGGVSESRASLEYLENIAKSSDITPSSRSSVMNASKLIYEPLPNPGTT